MPCEHRALKNCEGGRELEVDRPSVHSSLSAAPEDLLREQQKPRTATQSHGHGAHPKLYCH